MCGYKFKSKGLNKILKKTKLLLISIIILMVCFLGYLSISHLSKQNYKIGEVIEFGNYYQDDLTKKTPIKWRVSDIKDGKALLISESLIDTQPYNKELKAITWENSTIRQWLNSEFINEAFNSQEQSRISLTLLDNKDNPKYETSGGNDTKDRVFLLSLDEAQKYLPKKSQRAKKVTKYAIERGAYVCDKDSCGKYRGNGIWWLRSPGNFQGSAAFVGHDGRIPSNGYYVKYDSSAVLPALFINL